MKTRIPVLALAAALAVGIPMALVVAQTTASVTWNLVSPDSAKPSTIVGNLTAESVSGSNFAIRDYTGGNDGPLGKNMRWWPGSGVSWGPESLEVANRYIQFVAAPKTGNSFFIDSVAIWMAGGGTSNMFLNMYYSTDPTFATKTKVNVDSAIQLPHATNVGPRRNAAKIGITVPSGKSFYYRFYPWYNGAASTSKYVYTQLAVVKGTTSISTGIEDDPSELVPGQMQLLQNYPNPFNPTTTIQFVVGTYGYTSLKVFDMLGREVAILVNEERAPGVYTHTWDASALPSGIYLYRMHAGSFVETRKMILTK